MRRRAEELTYGCPRLHGFLSSYARSAGYEDVEAFISELDRDALYCLEWALSDKCSTCPHQHDRHRCPKLRDP